MQYVSALLFKFQMQLASRIRHSQVNQSRLMQKYGNKAFEQSW